MAFLNTPGNVPGPRVFFPFLEIPPYAHGISVSKPQARRGGSVAGPLAALGAARSGLRAPRWPACFARPGITPRHQAALCLRGRGQGSTALSGRLPRPARTSLLPCAREPREPSRPGRGRATARPTRSFGAAAGPSASRSIYRPGRGWRASCGHPAGLSQPASPGLSRRTGSRGGSMGVATLPSTDQCAEQHTRDHPNCPGSPGTKTLSTGFSNSSVHYTSLGI